MAARGKFPQRLIPFPPAEDVFAGDVEAHRRVLLPLISVPANWIDPSWPGYLHFVSPIEPHYGPLGMCSADFHSGYCRENWIAFRVVDSKYQFLGDFRYFDVNRPNVPEATHETLEYYAKVEQSFAETKLAAEQDRRPRGRSTASLYWGARIGGPPFAVNWTEPDEKVELVRQEGGMQAFPLTEDGRRFRFVGDVRGYRWNGPDGLLMFFDPETQTVLFTLEWT